MLISNSSTNQTPNNNGTAQTQNFIATPRYQPWQESGIALRQFTPLEQTQAQLALLRRDKNRPWAVIKRNSTKPYAYHFPSDTLWKLTTRQAQDGEHFLDDQDKRSRFDNGCLKYFFGRRYKQGFKQLEHFAKQGDELFVIPNYIPLQDGENGIGADFVESYPAIFAEIDDFSLDQQWQQIHHVQQKYGLEPTAVIFSGGKSLHIYFALKKPIFEAETWQRLQRKLICLFNSDPAIANPNREMRLAGVARHSKGSFQSLEQLTDNAYDAADVESKLDSSGLFPYGLDEERFRRWKREGQSIIVSRQMSLTHLERLLIPTKKQIDWGMPRP